MALWLVRAGLLKLWAEIYAKRAAASPDQVEAYQDFLLEVAAFDTHLFGPLYKQAVRFRRTDSVQVDQDFLDLAAELLPG